MKALPKRKGNPGVEVRECKKRGLNESPSEKEGKFEYTYNPEAVTLASMKALPKRKGNDTPKKSRPALDTQPQ